VALLGACRHWQQAVLAVPLLLQQLATAVLEVPAPAILSEDEVAGVAGPTGSAAQATVMTSTRQLG